MPTKRRYLMAALCATAPLTSCVAAAAPAAAVAAPAPAAAVAAPGLAELLPKALARLGLPPATGGGRLNGEAFPIAVFAGKVDASTLAPALRRELGDAFEVREERALAGPTLLITPRSTAWAAFASLVGRVRYRLAEAYSVSVVGAGPDQQIMIVTPMAPIVSVYEQRQAELHAYTGTLLAGSGLALRGPLDLEYRFGGMRVHSFQGVLPLAAADAWVTLDRALTAHGLRRLPRGPAPLAGAGERRTAPALGSAGNELYFASDAAVTVRLTPAGAGQVQLELSETSGQPGPLR